jgi:hypothetical protein
MLYFNPRRNATAVFIKTLDPGWGLFRLVDGPYAGHNTEWKLAGLEARS